MHDPSYDITRLDWQGILIEVRYCPSWSSAYKRAYGRGMAHIELETIEPAGAVLPLTTTGYRSIFEFADSIEEAGGAAAYVLDALEVAAPDPKWKAQEAAARQYALF